MFNFYQINYQIFYINENRTYFGNELALQMPQQLSLVAGALEYWVHIDQANLS